MVRLQRSLVTPCMCCSGRRVSSRTMPPARSNAPWLWMSTHNHFASAGAKRASHWELRESAFMQGRRSWQFRWRSLLRLHGLWRHRKHCGAAGSCQQATRHPICVSATLAARVEDFRGRSIGDLILRGRTEALRAFEPLRSDQYENPMTKSYLEAFAKLEAGDPAAMAGFAAHVGEHADDQLASFHLKRLLNGATGTRMVMD